MLLFRFDELEAWTIISFWTDNLLYRTVIFLLRAVVEVRIHSLYLCRLWYHKQVILFDEVLSVVYLHIDRNLRLLPRLGFWLWRGLRLNWYVWYVDVHVQLLLSKRFRICHWLFWFDRNQLRNFLLKVEYYWFNLKLWIWSMRYWCQCGLRLGARL